MTQNKLFVVPFTLDPDDTKRNATYQKHRKLIAPEKFKFKLKRGKEDENNDEDEEEEDEDDKKSETSCKSYED